MPTVFLSDSVTVFTSFRISAIWPCKDWIVGSSMKCVISPSLGIRGLPSVPGASTISDSPMRLVARLPIAALSKSTNSGFILMSTRALPFSSERRSITPTWMPEMSTRERGAMPVTSGRYAWTR